MAIQPGGGLLTVSMFARSSSFSIITIITSAR